MKYLYLYEANGGRAHLFPLDESSIFFKLCQSVMIDRFPQQVEKEITLKNGSKLWLQVNAAPIPEGIIVQSWDISEKKQEEQLIKDTLQEKEMLLKELYHRTKNNMQIISSLLALKATSLNDIKSKTILTDMTNRIKTIAKIHDMLHESNDLTQVDLSQYILHIINLLSISYMDNTERISIKKELDEIKVNIDTAISCGIIINELITNSLKHAFPGERRGEIIVKLAKPDDKIELCVSDNGIGFEKKETHDGKLGLQIFQLIAENQLKAETKLHFINGVTVNLRFRDYKHEKIKSLCE